MIKIDYILSCFQIRIHNYITDVSQFFQNCLNQIIYSCLRVQNNLKIKLVMYHFNLKQVKGVLDSLVGVWGILKGVRPKILDTPAANSPASLHTCSEKILQMISGQNTTTKLLCYAVLEGYSEHND